MPPFASDKEIADLRRPKQLYTTAYINDPIFFNTDQRLTPESVLAQVQNFTVVQRDFAQFATVHLSATASQFYPVAMYRTDVDRGDFLRHIDREFKQLV